MELRTALPTALIAGAVLGTSIIALETADAAKGSPAPIAALAVAELASVPVRWDIPVVWNESVTRFVKLFSGEQGRRQRGPKLHATSMEGSGSYAPGPTGARGVSPRYTLPAGSVGG